MIQIAYTFTLFMDLDDFTDICFGVNFVNRFSDVLSDS